MAETAGAVEQPAVANEVGASDCLLGNGYWSSASLTAGVWVVAVAVVMLAALLAKDDANGDAATLSVATVSAATVGAANGCASTALLTNCCDAAKC
eukprot:16265-Alexandrium_andersonii.AAC.1